MMSVPLQDLNEEVLRELRDRAYRHRRSVEAEALSTLEEALRRAGPRLAPAERLARARAISRMTPRAAQATDGVALLREERDL